MKARKENWLFKQLQRGRDDKTIFYKILTQNTRHLKIAYYDEKVS